MNILALSGSPRKNGNSETLLHAFLKKAPEAGCSVEFIRLCEFNIHPCLGCGGCDRTGECVVNDDMQLLYPKILLSPRIVLSSPIYFYGITAQAKAFIDRCQALWNRKRLAREGEHRSAGVARKGFLVTVSASAGKRVFDGAILTARYAFDAMGADYAGEYAVRGFDYRGGINSADAVLLSAAKAGLDFMNSPSGD